MTRNFKKKTAHQHFINAFANDLCTHITLTVVVIWLHVLQRHCYESSVEIMSKTAVTRLHKSTVNGKGKWSIAVRKTPHRYRNWNGIWDHTVLPATRQRWHSRLYPSRSWYSIKRPWRNARLSWPSWLITARDGIPARRRSPIPVVTGPDVR